MPYRINAPQGRAQDQTGRGGIGSQHDRLFVAGRSGRLSNAT